MIVASILITRVSNQWNDIAQLVVIVTIRTALNLLLERAIRLDSSLSSMSESANSPLRLMRFAKPLSLLE